MHTLLIRVWETNGLKVSEETAERLRQAARDILEHEEVTVELSVMARGDHGDNAVVV